MGRNAARLQWLAMGLLALGLTGVSPAQLLGALAIGLGALTALKLVEARRLGERRLVALLQLVGAGLQAALLPDLAPSLLQGATVLTALAGLLALEVGEGPDWRSLLRRSGSVLMAALPMALVLLLLVPRLGPFAALPGLEGGAALTGLNDSLDPGGIAALADDPGPAARVSFPFGGPPPENERYWRVLVHDRFDGRQWLAAPGARRDGAVLNAAPAAGAGEPGNLQELWLSEPSGLTTVPWSGSGRPVGDALRQDGRGELRLRAPSGSAGCMPSPPLTERRTGSGAGCRRARLTCSWPRAPIPAWRSWPPAGPGCRHRSSGWRRPRPGSGARASATPAARAPCRSGPPWMRSCSSSGPASAATSPGPSRP